MNDLATRATPALLSVLRIMAALLLMQHGMQKILGWPANPRPLPDAFTLYWFAGMLELVGGALLAIGLFTRPVAFVLAGLMAFAYFMGHAPRGNMFLPVLNGGNLAILYCFVFLYLSAAGPGPYSVDAARARARA
ncbi:DoxX family protein [Roseococcus sp. DSY-14]|uniref:DoxX family protein n=1 Tax=Roseococcus sp. DSY-14 TaxID=3369650 RepID=UPI00387B2A87